MPFLRIWRYARRVKNRSFDHDPLPSQLKHLVADMFRLDILEPDKISDEEPLIGGNLGLDSLDALELGMCLEEKFGITIGSATESRTALASIASLADFIRARGQTSPALSHSPATARIALQVLTSPLPV